MTQPVRTVRAGRSPKVLRAALVALTMLAATSMVACGEAADEAAPTTTDAPTTTAAATDDPEIAPDNSAAEPQDEGRGGVESDSPVIWPYADGSDTYSDPVELTRAFATEYLRFTKLVVGGFVDNGDDSGTVEIRSFEGGTPTLVEIIRISDDEGWAVTGATNETLVVETPAPNDTVTSPVAVSGQSTAFEGTIDVMVREYGRMDPLVRDFATGGANGEMGPFSTQLDLTEAGSDHGAVVVWTTSMEDGGTMAATVVGVLFG